MESCATQFQICSPPLCGIRDCRRAYGHIAIRGLSADLALLARHDHRVPCGNTCDQLRRAVLAGAVAGDFGQVLASSVVSWAVSVDSWSSKSATCITGVDSRVGHSNDRRCCRRDLRTELPEVLCANPRDG